MSDVVLLAVIVRPSTVHARQRTSLDSQCGYTTYRRFSPPHRLIHCRENAISF